MNTNLPTTESDFESAKQLLDRGLQILSKRRWWFVFAFVLVMGATVVITRHQPRIYEATGSVYIDRQPPKLLSGVNEVTTLGATGYFGTQQYYEAQKQILQSRALAQKVVSQLGLASDKHFLGLDLPGLDLTPEQIQRAMADADPAGMLAGRVKVMLADSSMIARVSIEDRSPDFAADLVNAVLEAYRDRNLEQKKTVTQKAFRDLREILGEMESKKDSAEQKLLDFETENDLSENRRKAVNERVLNLHTRLRRAQARGFAAHQRMRELKIYQGRTDLFSAGAPAVMTDGLIGQLKQRYLQLSIQKKELEGMYLSKHPKVKTIDDQLQHVTRIGVRHLRAMLTAATHEYNDARAEERYLEEQLKEATNEDRTIRLAQSKYEVRTSRRDETRRLYEMVANRLAETDLSKQVAENNVRILDSAVTPRTPIRPRVRLNYLVGLLLGLIVGFALALAIETLDNTVKSRYEVEEVIKVPYLGAIPTYDPNDNEDEGGDFPVQRMDLYAHYRPNSRVAEAARTLRTNILFMRPEKQIRSLVVTSAHPREGKTATSTTLAVALASASGSCVLVDTDLRKPRLHKVFGHPGDKGVTSYILSDRPVTDFVRPTEVPGLSLLACGPLPPNSSEILHAERFKQLVRELKDTYETVIFDSPPVEIVSDAMVLATSVDGVILVAQAGSSKLDALRSAVRSLKSVKADLLGVVLSRTASTGTGYGYYYSKGYRRGGKAYRYRYAEQRQQEEPQATAGEST